MILTIESVRRSSPFVWTRPISILRSFLMILLGLYYLNRLTSEARLLMTI